MYNYQRSVVIYHCRRCHPDWYTCYRGHQWWWWTDECNQTDRVRHFTCSNNHRRTKSVGNTSLKLNHLERTNGISFIKLLRAAAEVIPNAYGTRSVVAVRKNPVVGNTSKYSHIKRNYACKILSSHICLGLTNVSLHMRFPNQNFVLIFISLRVVYADWLLFRT